MSPDTLMGATNCAEETQLSDSYFYGVFKRRELPVVMIGRLPRVRRSDFEAWLASKTLPAREGKR